MRMLSDRCAELSRTRTQTVSRDLVGDFFVRKLYLVPAFRGRPIHPELLREQDGRDDHDLYDLERLEALPDAPALDLASRASRQTGRLTAGLHRQRGSR
jgi:hypothetical protein